MIITRETMKNYQATFPFEKKIYIVFEYENIFLQMQDLWLDKERSLFEH